MSIPFQRFAKKLHRDKLTQWEKKQVEIKESEGKVHTLNSDAVFYLKFYKSMFQHICISLLGLMETGLSWI